MSNAGRSATKHPLVRRLAILAVVFLVTGLAAVVGPNWVGLYVLPVVVIVGVVYGAIILMMWELECEIPKGVPALWRSSSPPETTYVPCSGPAPKVAP